ncbi:substrate-binding domain-containing protein [Crenobacter sp. SG2303]|uniref:Substrate-binding domain-containing protein n=1 Tax=Crenobacter oryzisoli TaxID=3056844 RepID=A0ABT7XSC2_9NEIS|nr:MULTISPECIES: substrate-binding domain-containing protein [unclassified Crenobacter]MDN0076706.1 substrate-binding domain-containing protein [Crenobacter sp. SG2303]MDN0085697.1 substrate-binding domain-containing protein [Crenobacter sp. SG2305]
MAKTWKPGCCLAGVLLAIGAVQAQADELKVVSSGGFAAALKLLAPQFEQQTGHHLQLDWGPSMGDTPQAIPQRLQRGEKIDVLVMVGSALDKLESSGKLLPDSRRVLASSRIALAVKHGSPQPDISTLAALKQTLLGSRSIAYSDSASGVFLSSVLFARLGVADQIKDRSRMIPAEPVGKVVARGEAELGFQQLSELIPVAGIDIVGLLPEEAQQVTTFSAGISRNSSHLDAARQLVRFLAAPQAAASIRQTGMTPASDSAQ